MKTFQIIIDSKNALPGGTSGNYVIDLKGDNSSSTTYKNVFYHNFRRIVGIKVLGVLLQQIKDIIPDVNDPSAIDIICPEIPLSAQQLSGPNGYVWHRVALDKNYGGVASSSSDMQDQWWEAPESKTTYFTPTQLSKLSITLQTNEFTPQEVDYVNYIIVEFTTDV